MSATISDWCRRCHRTHSLEAGQPCTGPDPTTRSRDPFLDHLDRASSIVARWPRWKRQILGGLDPAERRAVREAAKARDASEVEIALILRAKISA